MTKIITALHVTGVVLFFGSILGHAVVGLAENVNDSAETQLLARQIINVATMYLTIPGLALLLLSGIGLVVRRERPVRNLAPHLIIAILILLNAVFVLLPTGNAILSTASGTTGENIAALQALENREAIFGTINIFLCLVATFLGVFKPGTAETV